MPLPQVCIVSPALTDAHNGNAHTAARWQRFLAPLARVQAVLAWQGDPADALIALHARRSADSIARFRSAHPERALALVLTGTDLYRDLANGDAAAAHSLECASHVVVLQPQALAPLPAAVRAKARVILQSATRLVRHDRATTRVDFVAAGHLRAEKDPLTLMDAAQQLGSEPRLRIVHIGRALEPALGAAAHTTMHGCPGYRWLGGLPPAATRRWIARAHALVHMSRMEGGANVVIEALRCGVPVLASRIDGNLGLLGEDYEGYFPVGDAAALAALMRRFAHDSAFAARLAAQCAALAPQFAPAAEAAAVRQLLVDMLAGATQQRLPQWEGVSPIPRPAP
ncbi:selenoneine biosynthesis selenosugar synthase SenB [Ideonella sp. BN130291]|uniref:selenoneine biosynthesis selenosugar synthase SenB n=1 Tax=Ideonella sp. BN130291 TaxID=3112940 RepID=UPI002E26015D|nr:selenoneine biosynthesis selenosugar synthase SenB [Ideonella sp. BN130291]